MLSAKRVHSDTSRAQRPAIVRLARGAGRLLAVVACLLLIVNLLAIAAIMGEQTLAAASSSIDKRAWLPNYRDFPWAGRHFREFSELTTTHESFYGWRRLPYRGTTIEVDQDGLRRTWQDPAVTPSRTIAIFGGSTAWGSGSDDEHTIASLFARARSEYRAYNYGETAHTARQNVNRLLNMLSEGFQPDVVVFYNGSSEINKCRVGLGAFSDLDEQKIRELLDRDAAGLQGASAL